MLLLVGPYALIFVGKGNLWELAKFLPAWLGLLPPAIRTLLEAVGGLKSEAAKEEDQAPAG